MRKRIRVPLYGYQKPFFHAKGKSLFSGGYGAGKTYVGAYKLLLEHISNPGKIGFIGNTKVEQVQKINLAENLFPLFKKNGIRYNWNKTDKTIITQFGKIYYQGYKNYEEIIGSSYAYVWLDELDVARYPDKVWEKVLGRMRGKAEPNIFITTTPEGYKFTYRFFCPESPEHKHGYKIFYADTRDNPLYMVDYNRDKDKPIEEREYTSFVVDMLDVYDERLITAYLAGRHTNLLSGNCYYNFTREKNCGRLKVNWQATETLHIGIDFNVNPMCAAVGVFDGLNLYVIDEVKLQNSNTQSMVREIRRRYPIQKILWYPDMTGRKRQTSAEIGRTDISILQEEGIIVKNPFYEQNALVSDSLTVVNLALGKDKERTRVFIDSSTVNRNGKTVLKCGNLIQDLETVTYAKDGSIDKSDPEKTHMSDAFRYLTYRIFVKEFNFKDRRLEYAT